MTLSRVREEWKVLLRYFSEGVAADLTPPASRPPTPGEFSAFFNLGLCPMENRLEAETRLNRLLALTGKVATERRNDLLGELGDDELLDRIPLNELDDNDLLDHIPQDEYVFIRRVIEEGALHCKSDASGEIHLDAVELEEVRKNLPSKSRPNSFLIPLIKAWFSHPGPLPSEPERRRGRILPETVRYALPAQQALPVPTEGVLPEMGQQPLRTAYLPGLEPPAGVVIPVLPLQVAKVSTAGAGAPITPRLWFGFQMALPLDRRTGEEVRLLLTLRDMCTWLWPNGWNRNRDLPRLREGLRNLYQLGIIWDRGEWLLVRPVKLPTLETRLDDYLIVDVTALPGSDRGPMIDTERLWRLGAMAGAPWRMWIRLAYVWDAVKKQNGGNRIYATRPEVKRGEGGVILDHHGRPLLDRHKKPVLDWSDKRAVRTGRQERHPQAGRVPPLGTRDLALLGFDDAEVPAGTLRRRATETRTWLTKMEQMKVIALEFEGKEIRVLETYPEQGSNGNSSAGASERPG